MPYDPNKHHRRSIRLKGYDYTQPGYHFITICVQDRRYLFGQISNGKMKLNDAGRMVKKWYYELENKFRDKKCHQMVIMPNHFHCIIENVTPIGADRSVCPYKTNDKTILNKQNILGQQTILKEQTILGEQNILGQQTILNEQTILGEQTISGSQPGRGEQNILGQQTILNEQTILGGQTISGSQPGRGEQIILGQQTILNEQTILGEQNILGSQTILNEQTILGGQNILGSHTDRGEHLGSPLYRAVQWFKTMSTNEYIRGVKQNGWQPFNRKLWQRNYWEHIIRNEQSYQTISDYIINNPAKWNDDKFYTQWPGNTQKII